MTEPTTVADPSWASAPEEVEEGEAVVLELPAVIDYHYVFQRDREHGSWNQMGWFDTRERAVQHVHTSGWDPTECRIVKITLPL